MSAFKLFIDGKPIQTQAIDEETGNIVEVDEVFLRRA